VEQNIGLGQDAHHITLDIWWPATGAQQHFTDIAKNQHLEIKEFATSYTRLDRKPFQWGQRTASLANATAVGSK
jgi:hypothetical protein